MRRAFEALLWYDSLLTLPAEIEGIWQRKKLLTGATMVYLLTRYVAILERIVLVMTVMLTTISDEARPVSSFLKLPANTCIALCRHATYWEIWTPR